MSRGCVAFGCLSSTCRNGGLIAGESVSPERRLISQLKGGERSQCPKGCEGQSVGKKREGDEGGVREGEEERKGSPHWVTGV